MTTEALNVLRSKLDTIEVLADAAAHRHRLLRTHVRDVKMLLDELEVEAAGGHQVGHADTLERTTEDLIEAGDLHPDA